MASKKAAPQQKVLFGVRVDASVLDKFRSFCKENGDVKQGFVIAEALDEYYRSRPLPRKRKTKPE